MSTSVMEEMVGHWKLESRDPNFGDFLICRQVGWFLRTMMTSSKADVEYQLSPDKSTFTKVTSTYGGTSHYPMPIEKDFFPAKTLSGKDEMGRIFEISGGSMVQEMSFVDTSNIAAVLKHQVVDGKLVIDMQCKDIKCRSIYNKVEK